MYSESKTRLTITPETKISELLDVYPALESKLIEIAPVFSKLQNPVLRKTISKVTSLRQVSIVANLPINYLVNELREEAGQNSELFKEIQLKENPMDSNITSVKEIYDATSDLEEGKHPLAKVMNDIQQLAKGESYLLITPFIPAPLIEKVREKGFNVKSEETKDHTFENYIWC
ncbi:MAG: DUF1858 domain-containing protein [Ignavibacteriales bacterium]|nr:MAG: DUF1858 domain-containing protein [Ignavibacteriales bacterium]